MDQARIGELHRRLYVALDKVQKSSKTRKAGTVPGDEMRQDLLEQLAIAQKAAQDWQALLNGGESRH